MVKVAEFGNETEAHLAKDYLESKDIPARILGAKEYTAHVLGGGAGHFELMVDPINLQLAQRWLAEIQQNSETPSEVLEPDHFRRAIFYVVVATIILPLIFNYASLVQARKFWIQSDKGTVARLKLALILVLQLLPFSLIGFYIYTSHWFG